MREDSDETVPTLRVIVVGSSAGGLDALTSMLGVVEVGLGWCVVVAQHMAPTEASELAHILDRTTDLQVVEAVDGAPLRADTVFIAPPGHDILVDGHRIAIEAPSANTRPWPSIDRLFISAARAFEDRSVAVVLSGTGNDGASGVEAVESAGGLVAVQELATAAFEPMPAATFATGSVDIEAPAQDIPRELKRYLDNNTLMDYGGSLTDDLADTVHLGPAHLDDILEALHAETGLDFSGYKTSTLERQIARRQRLLNIGSASSYATLLRDAPTEASALSRALLVTVTAFFRDRDVWDGIREHLRTAVEASGSDQVRIWVPGCASGQEAYTIAMLAADVLGIEADELSSRVKIFATDLDEHALNVARAGKYPSSEADEIPENYRRRWTRIVDGTVEMLPALRESIVFARHNVAFDPPFPNLDLISLRNTLIYFQPRLQEQVLHLCQFALNPKGLLLLGQSERVPRTDEAFTVVDPDRRLYRRRQHLRVLGLPLRGVFPLTRSPKQAEQVDVSTHTSVADREFYRDIVRSVVPAALIVDDRSILIEVVGDVGKWCTISEGVHSGSVVDLLKEQYRATVRAMLSQVQHSAPKATTRTIRSDEATTRISVTRIGSSLADGSGDGAIVAFDSEPVLHVGPDPETVGTAVDFSDELETVYDALQATVEDLSTANEELQALNEELQASSEELQASSEEVQASNEELEATNEELTTLNQELTTRGTELTRANIDLENIQSSLTNGLVLLDRDLRVTRFTPLAVRLFSLIPSDIGRTLSAVPTAITVPGLDDALQRTLGGDSILIELESDQRDLLMQTQPYRGDNSEILGVIVVVIDVSDITAERRARERALTNLEIVTESIRELVWQRDTSGVLTLLTRRVEELYGLDRTRVLADPSLLRAAVHPDDRERVAAVSASTDQSWQIQYRIIRPDGTIRWIDESATYMQPPDGSPPVRVGSAFDISEQKELAARIDGQAKLIESLFLNSSLGLLLVDGRGRIERVSPVIEAMTGYTADALEGRILSSLIPSIRHDNENRAPTNRALVRADGHTVPASVEFVDGAGVGRSVVVVQDSSRLRRLSAELAAHEQFDQQTGLLTRTFFRARATDVVAASNDPSAVLWIDLDGFKEVNDRLGHRNGDLVLGVVAHRLKGAVRKDNLIGRFGGDEFAILVSRADDLDALDSLVHRILNVVREPIVVDDSHAFVSASIGIAVQPTDGNTADELLHNADVAMYSAKQNGRDQHVYFTTEMDRDADARATVRHQLSAAVRSRDFELHYQPIRSIATGDIAMIEALVRWRRDGELVSAGEFIDIAADTGQLRALGHLVLDCLIEDVGTLHERFGADHPRVAVNMSATELRERDLMDRLLGWRPAAGFEKIVIEVTEQITLTPGDRAFGVLTLLQRLGATISIDDFGTGYSNLELLGQLKPGIIKIDRSLTERAAEDSRGERILEAAVGLAHALETTAVIEGAGDARLSAVAVASGAELAQGYHLGRPMSLADIIDSIAGDPAADPT
ncbi:PAS domain S-box protein [Rhodococcus sp. 14-2686-1-2]|nr:PAS domain S-box protein [Rhodococcus sp. 15-1189-1-1a]OZF15566.1 PAS domain S-box protein [Rhodococcus sp. 14-2686-1-2]